MKSLARIALWTGVALLGAAAYAVIALKRGEPLNAAWLIVAALCTYAIGIRFYSKWIAAKVLMLDDLRAPPAEVHDDGRDYVKTNKYVLFGHHFASISGPGPLVGPVLAAQFGYLPGTLWILIGTLLGGAVQDFVILFASVRRDGKSLAEMVREEVGGAAGTIAMVAILGILVILVANLGLVVDNALAESPWGVVTTAMTMPFAMIMGLYVRYLRVGKVMEMTAIGVVFLAGALLAGFAVNHHPTLAPMFTLSKERLAVCLIVYGFAASVLPVWLLLAPRDYL
ncbi:MAG TPA: carbon starvation CstA family protein, partial [Polyangia bacterium]